MSTFKPKEDDYVECISESFTKQGVMETLSARLNTRVVGRDGVAGQLTVLRSLKVE